MIQVTHYYGVHQGGTKDYHLYLVQSAQTKQSLLVKRWGKTGSDGQVKVEPITGNGDAELNKFLKERASKGYDMRRQEVALNSRELDSYPDAASVIDRVFSRHARSFTHNLLAYIDPAYRKGDKTTFDPLSGDRDKMRRDMEAQAEAIAAAKRAQEAAETDDLLRSNPIYGMF